MDLPVVSTSEQKPDKPIRPLWPLSQPPLHQLIAGYPADRCCDRNLDDLTAQVVAVLIARDQLRFVIRPGGGGLCCLVINHLFIPWTSAFERMENRPEGLPRAN